MNFWIILNALLSAAVAALLTYKLVYLAERCSCPERVGIALIASAMVLNIGPILAKSGFPYGNGVATPFDDWASTLLRIGLLVYFAARVLKHWHNNRAQLGIAQEHFRHKGERR